MRDYSVLNGMIENQKSELRTAYDKGYEQGYVEGQKHDLEHTENIVRSHEKCKSILEAEYERGMNDAWRVVTEFLLMGNFDRVMTFNTRFIAELLQSEPKNAVERLKEYNKVRCCKNCKHSKNGMVGNSKRCEDCYYDEQLKGNTLFEPMETDNGKIEVGDVCRYQTCKRIFIITSIHEGFGGEEYFDAIYSNGEAIKNGKLSVIEKINGECVEKLNNMFSALIDICISGKADA